MRIAFILLLLGSTATAADRPNFVLIYIDDLGWADVGFNGSRFYLTPNIDRMAREGMQFTNAYANAPNCAPSRACLMSGLYSPRHGVYTVGSSKRGSVKARRLVPTRNKTTLAPRFQTIAESLRAAGYATAHMGKWHLGGGAQTGPKGQGFDTNVGGNRTGTPRGGYFPPYRNPQLKNGPEGEYLTDRLTSEAVEWITDHKDQPFFLYLAHYAVHTPIQAKRKLIAKYRNRKPYRGQRNPRYAAMIDSMDQSVGRVLATLKKHKLDEKTMVIFYSDNGGFGGATSNRPLRGAKGMLYEGGIRVPMAVRWSGRVKPGTRCDVPVIGVDFFPTFAELSSSKTPKRLDGKSFVRLLKDPTNKDLSERSLFWHFPAYLQGKVKGARDNFFRTRPAAAIRKGKWKLIEYFEDGHLELYNLQTDLGEKENLAKSKPEIVKRLHAEMKQWRKDVKAPVPTERNERFDPSFKPRKKKRRRRK